MLLKVVWKSTTDLGCGIAGGPPPERVLLVLQLCHGFLPLLMVVALDISFKLVMVIERKL